MIGLTIVAQSGNFASDQAGVDPGEIFSMKFLGPRSNFRGTPGLFELSTIQILQNRFHVRYSRRPPLLQSFLLVLPFFRLLRWFLLSILSMYLNQSKWELLCAWKLINSFGEKESQSKIVIRECCKESLITLSA